MEADIHFFAVSHSKFNCIPKGRLPFLPCESAKWGPVPISRFIIFNRKFTRIGHAQQPRGYANRNLNSFGQSVELLGPTWTVELCQLDSDGDGFTNGEELGDPDCTWQEGDPVQCTGCPSHPGDASEAGLCGTGLSCIDAEAEEAKYKAHGLILFDKKKDFSWRLHG